VQPSAVVVFELGQVVVLAFGMGLALGLVVGTLAVVLACWNPWDVVTGHRRSPARRVASNEP
jgi:hypothetical protein